MLISCFYVPGSVLTTLYSFILLTICHKYYSHSHRAQSCQISPTSPSAWIQTHFYMISNQIGDKFCFTMVEEIDFVGSGSSKLSPQFSSGIHVN